MSDNCFNFIFALYIFCAYHHSGQWYCGYRISHQYRPRIPDSAWSAIKGNRHSEERFNRDSWDEWENARRYYRELKRKYAGKV